MVTALLAAGLVLALALLIALHYRLDGLPVALGIEVRRERQDNATRALDLMKEAVATKAGTAVLSIQRHEENLAAGHRAQVAEAQLRARMGEVRSGDTVTALTAATTLVRELRQVLDQLPREAALPPPIDPSERVTVELKPEAVETARRSGAPEPASRERPSPRHGFPAVAPEDGDERAGLAR
jgi:hypothetical protein